MVPPASGLFAKWMETFQLNALQMAEMQMSG